MQSVPVVCDADDGSHFSVYHDGLAADIVAGGRREIIIPFKNYLVAVGLEQLLDSRVFINVDIVMIACAEALAVLFDIEQDKALIAVCEIHKEQVLIVAVEHGALYHTNEHKIKLSGIQLLDFFGKCKEPFVSKSVFSYKVFAQLVLFGFRKALVDHSTVFFKIIYQPALRIVIKLFIVKKGDVLERKVDAFLDKRVLRFKEAVHGVDVYLLADDNGKQQEQRQHNSSYLKQQPAFFVFAFHCAYLLCFCPFSVL